VRAAFFDGLMGGRDRGLQERENQQRDEHDSP
jgi:hypothetical protein